MRADGEFRELIALIGVDMICNGVGIGCVGAEGEEGDEGTPPFVLALAVAGETVSTRGGGPTADCCGSPRGSGGLVKRTGVAVTGTATGVSDWAEIAP